MSPLNLPDEQQFSDVIHQPVTTEDAWTPPQGGGGMITSQEAATGAPSWITGIQDAIAGIHTGFTEPLFDAVFGSDAAGELETGGVMGFFQSLQGDFMAGGIGNIADAFGVPPQVLLIGGVIAAIIVIVMVIKK